MKKKWIRLVYPKCKKFFRIMKITVLIVTLTLYQVSASVYSQNTKLSFSLKDASIEKVFDEIKQKTKFNFLYRSDLFNDVPLVNINVDKVKVEEILDQVIVANGFTYEIEDKTVVIHKTPPKPVLNEQEQQKKEVKGKVTDEKGEPLPGVSIVVKGTTVGITTDIDGSYTLEISDDAKVLVFSFVGMETQEIEISNQVTIDVAFVLSAVDLDDVVVTALGLSRRMRSLGYSVGKVNDDEINSVPHENVLGGLSGKVSGLDIRRVGGDLNGRTFVYIRGRTSLTGNDEPLVIVDGTPVGGTSVMSDISAMNIESVSVLKGASAAALYGSRAGNGVIIITTKSGKGLKRGIGVSVNLTATFNKPYKYFDLQNRFTNGKSHGLFDEGQWQHWWGAEEGTMAVQWNTDGEEMPLKFYQNSLEDYFQTGFTTVNDVSITGNYDEGSFRLTISQTSGYGFSPGTDLQKLGFNLATTYKIAKKFTISSNIDISHPSSNNSPYEAVHRDDQYFDIFNIAPHININDLKGDLWNVLNIEQRKIYEVANNPWWSAEYVKFPYDRIRGFGNIKLDWDILPSLRAFVRAALSSSDGKSEIMKPWSYVSFITSNPHGAYSVSHSTSRESNVDFLLSYNKKIKDFSISASVGGNIRNNYSTSISTGGSKIVLPGLFTASNIEKGVLGYGSSTYKKLVYSVYGVANLGYKNMIYLDLTGRNDWSSTLPEENRSYFYPSASLSLLISEMVQMPSWLSLVKLRSGWAQVGKDTGPYAIHPSLSRGTWGSDVTYSLPGSKPNTTLKPEIGTSYEVGADLGFFQGRLGFEGTYYKTQNKNQIMGVSLPCMTGYAASIVNAGNVENSGVELGLKAVPIRTKDFEWGLNINFAKSKSKIVELVEGTEMVFFGVGGVYAFTRVGGEIGDMYAWGTKKVEEGPYKGWHELDNNGRMIREYDIANMPLVGNFSNDFSMGFNTSVSYKSFTLSASIDWRQGGDFYSETIQRMTRSGKIEEYKRSNGQITSTFKGVLGANDYNGLSDELANEIKNNPDYRDYDVWVGGRNEELGGFLYDGYYTGAFFPGVIANGDGTYTENFGAEGTKLFDAYRTFNSSGSFWDTNEAFMFDASFVKMRDITLSYELPARISGAIKAQGISVSVYAKNIMLWTKAGIGVDPESAYSGSGSGNFQGYERWSTTPWTVPIGFRLNVKF